MLHKNSTLKFLSFVLLFSSVFFSCDDDGIDSLNIWTPNLLVLRGNEEATLLLSDPRPYTTFSPPPSNPDYFEILISENLTDFTVYKTVDISTNSVLIDNLVNGKSYYFSVKTYKNNSAIGKPEIVMITPSAGQQPEVYLPNLNFSTERLSVSYDMSYLSFRSYDYITSNGSRFYLKDNTSGVISTLDADISAVNWSSTTNELVYLTSKRIDNKNYPFEIKSFNPDLNVSKTLFEIPYNFYSVFHPTLTPNGEEIAFMSNEDNTESYIYDLWTMNLIDKEKVRLTTFKDLGLILYGNYVFYNSGEQLYLDGRYENEYANSIYKMDVSTKAFSPVFESQWDDIAPVPSPDNTKLAFISDRTGRKELWVYDLVDLDYTQITEVPPYSFDSRYSNYQWLDNDELLITMFKNSKSIAIKIKVE